MCFGLKGLELKFYKNAIGVGQEGIRNLKFLRCSSKKSDMKASVVMGIH